MFEHQNKGSELDTPPIAKSNADAVEILRVWAAEDVGQQLVLRTTWDDPAGWGLLLADVARHVANAYAVEGYDQEAVLKRVKAAFQAEWDDPTDQPLDITPR
jgi:hypothetical protein